MPATQRRGWTPTLTAVVASDLLSKAAEGGDYRSYLTSTGSGMGTLADALKSKLNRS